MCQRREPARRATPDLIAFHKLDAKRLRLEARRRIWRKLRNFIATLFEDLPARRKL